MFFSLYLFFSSLSPLTHGETQQPPWPSSQHQEVYIQDPAPITQEVVHEGPEVPTADALSEEDFNQLAEEEYLQSAQTSPASDPLPLAVELGLSADLMLIHPRPTAQITRTRSEISPRLNLRFSEDLKFIFRVNFLDGGVDRHPGGSSPKGEILTEQAFLDWSIESWTSRVNSYQVQRSLRLGLQLLPLGIVNPESSPDSYMTVLPPKVETYIIPRRWSEMGVVYQAQHNQLGSGLTYRIGLFNSLDANKLRPDSYLSRGVQGGNGKAQDPSILAGIDIEDENFSFGGSYLYGHTGHSLEGLGFSPLHLYEVHFKSRLGKLITLTGLFAEAHLLDSSAIQIVNNTSTFGKKARGYYLNLSLDLFHQSPSRAWPLFVRLESYNLHQEVAANETPDPQLKQRNISYGMNYSPNPHLIFKFDYQDRKNGLGSESGVFSIGLSFIY